MCGSDIERAKHKLLDLWLEHTLVPRNRGELEVRLEEIRIEFQRIVPYGIPIPLYFGETLLQCLTTAIVRTRGLSETFFLKHFGEDRHRHIRSVNTDGTGQLEHFHQFFTCGAEIHRHFQMHLDAGSEEMGRGRIHGNIDELLD